MTQLTKRINIHGRCRSGRLWSGKVSAGDTLGVEGEHLDGVKPSTWEPRGSDREERSLRVNEGETWRNIPLYCFNILQAAQNEPAETAAIVMDEVPELEEKFDLLSIEPGTREFYVELAEILAYLSVDYSEDYAERYWFNPWRKAKERNPDLLGEGRQVIHPGKDATAGDDDQGEPSEEVTSAAEADW